MSTKYFCLDFETANSEPGDICSVGIVCVENGIITQEFYSLVNPETAFDPFCTEIHGITSDDVRDSPKIPEIIAQIEPLMLEYNNLIAHYAPFDAKHLIGAYGRAGRQLIDLSGVYCTRCISRRAFPGRISYSLHQLVDLFDCSYDAHNAIGDARACNALLNSCFAASGSSNLDDLCDKLRIRAGRICAGEYTPCLAKNISVSPISPKPSSGKFDETHPFFGQEVVFTGTLSSMRRADAAQLVVDCGGIYSNSLKKTTNYLVMGMQDAQKLKGNEKSSKVIKAEKMLESGADIQIIGEDEFLVLIN